MKLFIVDYLEGVLLLGVIEPPPLMSMLLVVDFTPTDDNSPLLDDTIDDENGAIMLTLDGLYSILVIVGYFDFFCRNCGG